jgi:hypothetical protein
MISEITGSAPSRIAGIVAIVWILVRFPGLQHHVIIVPDRQIRKIPTHKGVCDFGKKEKRRGNRGIVEYSP